MKDEWFGTVRWNEVDLANALELHDYPATEANIAKLREMCDNHWFTDYMIESGWSYIYDKIDNFGGFEINEEAK